jgi:hypothetical protein
VLLILLYTSVCGEVGGVCVCGAVSCPVAPGTYFGAVLDKCAVCVCLPIRIARLYRKSLGPLFFSLTFFFLQIQKLSTSSNPIIAMEAKWACVCIVPNAVVH